LDTDRLLALVRAIEVVGEAASKVSSKNSGCRSRHTVGIEVVWKTVTEELPQLLPRLRAPVATQVNT